MNLIYLVLTLSFVISQDDKSGVKKEKGNNEEKAGVKKSLKIDYCSINKEHILCGANGSSVLMRGITRFYPANETHRAIFLDILNKQRNQTASGLLKRKGVFFPVAANMFEMEWSSQLERAAFNGIKNCNENETYRNCCNCMNTGKTDISYLILMRTIYDHEIGSLPELLNDIFYFGSQRGAPIKSECFDNLTEECLATDSFYLRLLNARTVQIGCVFVQCPKPKKSPLYKADSYLNCISNLNYLKDIVHHPLYKQGSSCSMCPKGSSCSKKYNQLCKCNKISDCLITPSELKTECTERKNVTKGPPITQQTIPQTPSMKIENPYVVPNVKIDFPSETTIATTTTTTTKVTGDSGGDQVNSRGLTFSCFENFVISFILSAAVIIN